MFFDDLSRYHDFYKENEKEILSYLRFASYSAMIVTLVSLFIDISVYGEYRIATWRLIIVVSSAIMFLYDLFKKKWGNYKKTVYFNMLFHFLITVSASGMVWEILVGENFDEIYNSNIVMTFSLIVVSQSYFISKARKFFYLSVVPPIAAMTIGLILKNVSTEVWLSLFNFYVLVFIVIYLGYRGILKDIRCFYETKKRNEEILKLKENNLKDDLISNVSHELRSPLMGIIGIQELLIDSNMNQDHKDLLSLSRQSAYQLLHMINDILEVSTKNEYKISLKLQEVDICLFAREIFEQNCSLKNDNIEYIFKCPDDQSLKIMTDPVKLSQIFNNILGNACKFTEKGKISFKISKYSENDDIVGLQFVIEDSGIGIPKDKTEKIFERFYQVDSSLSKKYKGTGIGLSIVKMVAELMGGTVECDSELGKGTKFIVKISFAKAIKAINPTS
jgi:signal transduction histidine kinase